MGGLNSEVDSETKNILLEVAHFNPSEYKEDFEKAGTFE